MHFWIDKRSQTCGFSGRHRVPSSLSAGCGQQQRRRRRSRGKPMVTPVHRFQPVECVQQGSAAAAAAHHAARRHQQQQQQQHRQLHSCLPPAYRCAPQRRRHGLGNGLTSPPGAPVRSSGPHAVELDSSVFLDLPLDGSGNDGAAHNAPQPQLLPVGRLKCGMWASFGLATVFVAGAKFYFDHQGTGLEVLVFCALLIVFLLAGCTVSLCRSKATRDLLAAAVTSSQPPHSTVSSQQGQSQSNEQLEVVSTEDIGLNQIMNQANPLIFSPVAGPPQSPVTAPEPPPPPYHIAILLPQQTHTSNQSTTANEESPPPSYDKVVS